MAMGWDDAIMLLMAAASTASAMNPPENNFQTPAAGAGQMPQGIGGSPLQPQAQSAPPATNIQPIQTDPLQGIAAALASTGPPPAQQQQQPIPTTGDKPVVGPPSPSEDPLVQSKKNDAATKSIWAALPQAIAMAAPLLGMNQQDNRQVAAPPAGGPGGQTAFQSPVRRPSIGEILNSLPRLR